MSLSEGYKKTIAPVRAAFGGGGAVVVSTYRIDEACTEENAPAEKPATSQPQVAAPK